MTSAHLAIRMADNYTLRRTLAAAIRAGETAAASMLQRELASRGVA